MPRSIPRAIEFVISQSDCLALFLPRISFGRGAFWCSGCEGRRGAAPPLRTPTQAPSGHFEPEHFWRSRKHLRVSQSAVAYWESGRTLPSSVMRSRIENALNVTPSQDEERQRKSRPF